MTRNEVNVLVVGDPGAWRQHLQQHLDDAAGFRVAGASGGGDAALAFLADTAVDVVLLDAGMGEVDAYDTARRIMETRPVPVVMCSASNDPDAVASAFHAYEAGAVAVVERPGPPGHPDTGRLAAAMLQTLRLMSEVKVVRRWPRPGRRAAAAPDRPDRPGPVRLVGIGASTGGPPALQTVLGGLGRDFPAAILVVQHISSGFLPGLVDWLAQTTRLEVEVAAHGIEPRAGHVYLAPDGRHLGIDRNGRLHLDPAPPENGLRPAVDHLLRSLAIHCGPRAAGVLLTGMGRDGAAGMRAMRERGAVTIAQDRDTSVIHGMPGAAIALDAATDILPLDRIAEALRRAVAPPTGGKTGQTGNA